MENAERNVLPTLNNLLENREMSLEDGRYLLKQSTYESLQHGQMDQIQLNQLNEEKENKSILMEKKSAGNLVPVHPNFRVIALSCPVPPYPGKYIYICGGDDVICIFIYALINLHMKLYMYSYQI